MYKNLNRESLANLCEERGIEFVDADTKAMLIDKLEKADAEKNKDGAGSPPSPPPAPPTPPTEKPEEYALTPFIKEKGYKAKIDNKLVIVHKTEYAKNTTIVVKECYCEVQTGFDSVKGTPVLKNTGSVLSGLTDIQLFQLVHADVITLNEKQTEAFKLKFNTPQK